MKNSGSYIKIWLPFCGVVCILLSIVFFVLKSMELEEEINEAQSRYESTEIVYKIRRYIASVSVQISEEIFADYQKGKYDEYGEQYSLIETEEDNYVVTLYDKENNVIHTEVYSKLPWIEEKTDNILQIGMAAGNVSAFIFYYDKERAVVSPFYTESFYLRDNYVAYMEDESTLILTDIFDDGELYMKIHRNFSDSLNLGGLRLSIKDITMITLNGQDLVVLEYYEGEDRNLVSDIIPIDEEGISFDELNEIERDYEILEYDICSPVLYNFEDVNSVVKKHIEYKRSMNEELSQKYGRELKIGIDYHIFDFDDDGLDDYLLCIDRELYDGKMEHWIEIYVTRQERGWIGHEREMEMAYERLELNLPAYNQAEGNGHKQIIILREIECERIRQDSDCNK